MWGESFGALWGLGVGEVRRRLDAEKVTVAEILGGGVGGFGREEDGDEDEDEGFGGVGVLGFGAKKRDMTCCFCFPMAMVALAMHCFWEWDFGLFIKEFSELLSISRAFIVSGSPPSWLPPFHGPRNTISFKSHGTFIKREL